MKIYYPSYFKDFKCIADRCRHSCCVGWEIQIDGATINKYSALPKGEREDILSHIDGNGCVMLTDSERCPFLESDGLCRLITAYGDSHISRICQEHPRFYHRVGDRVECGIGASCEEACRIILSSDFDSFYSDEKNDVDVAEETDFDTPSHRSWIYNVLSDNSLFYREKLELIKEKYGISDSIFTNESLSAAFSELEYLDDGHREIITVGAEDNRPELHPYFERFLAYLIFRHLTIAESYDGLRARLGFCLLLLRMLENATVKSVGDFESVCDIVRIISEEIEYSEENTASLIFELECLI